MSPTTSPGRLSAGRSTGRARASSGGRANAGRAAVAGLVCAVLTGVAGGGLRPATAQALGVPDAQDLGQAVESAWGDLELEDLSGRVWTGVELAGRTVLIDFWATWCAPCLAELPTLRQAQREFEDDGLLILGVAVDTTPRARLQSFLRRHAIDWPQVFDGRGFDGELARFFRVQSVPRSVLLDRAGRVVAVDLRGPTLLAALRSVMAASRKPAP